MSPQQTAKHALTTEQQTALQELAARYNAEVDWEQILVGVSDLPSDWILSSIGPITVAVSPAGDIHS
jgi:hypothetical protein